MSEPKPKIPKKIKDSEIEQLKKQIIALTDALRVERADAINLRRRHEQELASLRTRLKSSVIYELLPVIDNLERSLIHVPEDLKDNNYVKGVAGVIKLFEKTLNDMGVERIKTVGEAFDPKYHEAVSFDDGEGKHEIISEELQAGYKINGEVIRHAMVKVVKR